MGLVQEYNSIYPDPVVEKDRPGLGFAVTVGGSAALWTGIAAVAFSLAGTTPSKVAHTIIPKIESAIAGFDAPSKNICP